MYHNGCPCMLMLLNLQTSSCWCAHCSFAVARRGLPVRWSDSGGVGGLSRARPAAQQRQTRLAAFAAQLAVPAKAPLPLPSLLKKAAAPARVRARSRACKGSRPGQCCLPYRRTWLPAHSQGGASPAAAALTWCHPAFAHVEGCMHLLRSWWGGQADSLACCPHHQAHCMPGSS